MADNHTAMLKNNVLGALIQNEIIRSDWSSLDKFEKSLIDFITFYCHPDDESCLETANIKKEIYSLYADCISLTISKIEVYSHNLEANTVESIFSLLQELIAAELEDEAEKKIKLYQTVLKSSYFLKHTVQIHLIDEYFDRISLYKKNIKNFKHKGRRVSNTPIRKYINNNIKQIKKQYKVSLKRYNTFYKRKRKKDFIFYDKVEENINLDVILLDLEALKAECEQNYPTILCNGYRMPLAYRLINKSIATASGILLISAFMKYLGVWQSFIDFIYSLF